MSLNHKLSEVNELQQKLKVVNDELTEDLYKLGLATQPKWTKAMPTAPGLYMMKSRLEDDPTYTGVYITTAGNVQLAGYRSGDSNLLDYFRAGWWFAGPYPEPLPPDFVPEYVDNESTLKRKITVNKNQQ